MTDKNIVFGGWVWANEKPADIEKWLEKAQPQGAKYKLIAYCGSQLVSGMNYLLICEKTTVAPNYDKAAVSAVVLTKDLEGNCRIRPITDIDLTGRI